MSNTQFQVIPPQIDSFSLANDTKQLKLIENRWNDKDCVGLPLHKLYIWRIPNATRPLSVCVCRHRRNVRSNLSIGLFERQTTRREERPKKVDSIIFDRIATLPEIRAVVWCLHCTSRDCNMLGKQTQHPKLGLCGFRRMNLIKQTKPIAIAIDEFVNEDKIECPIGLH